jgi:hypothetical protein
VGLLGLTVSACSIATTSQPVARPQPSPIVLLPCGAIVIGVHPSVPGIVSGTIVPGRGVAGIEVGMTRDQVIARVGRPVCEVGNPGQLGSGIWDFAPPAIGDRPSNETRLFATFQPPDVDSRPNAKIVNLVVAGPGFRFGDGTPAFQPGSYDHFTKLYAGRVEAIDDHSADGTWTYRVSPDPGAVSAGVPTAFHGRAPGPNALDQGTVSMSATT